VLLPPLVCDSARFASTIHYSFGLSHESFLSYLRVILLATALARRFRHCRGADLRGVTEGGNLEGRWLAYRA
jgi:hypothetical protein